MASTVGPTATATGMSPAFENIRSDLAVIKKEEVRKESQRLFQWVTGSIYVLERDPENYPRTLRKALGDLADYLEAHDKEA